MIKIVKNFYEKHVYLNDKLDPIFDLYYKVLSFYKNCKRLIEYAPLVWHHRNWDYGFILRFNKKLHEDLYKGMFIEGSGFSDESKRKQLKIVIELFDRLEKDKYEDIAHNLLDRKYGQSYFKTLKIEGSESKPGGPWYKMIDTRTESMSASEKLKYHKDHARAFKEADNKRRIDTELLYTYIAIYSKKWWD